jgi:hypothetical protein
MAARVRSCGARNKIEEISGCGVLGLATCESASIGHRCGRATARQGQLRWRGRRPDAPQDPRLPLLAQPCIPAGTSVGGNPNLYRTDLSSLQRTKTDRRGAERPRGLLEANEHGCEKKFARREEIRPKFPLYGVRNLSEELAGAIPDRARNQRRGNEEKRTMNATPAEMTGSGDFRTGLTTVAIADPFGTSTKNLAGRRHRWREPFTVPRLG